MRYAPRLTERRLVPQYDFFEGIVGRPSHNNVVAWGLRDPIVLSDVMRMSLEPKLYAALDWKRVQIEESVFVDSRNRLFLDDARFSVPYHDGSGTQYFVEEHKSKPELRAFQQLMTSVWRDCVFSSRNARGESSRRAYLTIPFLFYTGVPRWIFEEPTPTLRDRFLVCSETRLFNESCDELFYKFSVVYSNWRSKQLASRTYVFLDLLERVAKRVPDLRNYEWFEPLRRVKGDESLEKFKRVLNSYWIESVNSIEGRPFSPREILEILENFGDEGAIETMNATFEMLEKDGIRKGVKQGVKQGVKKGVKKGERAENTALICRQLRSRFGVCPDYLKERVRSCPKRSTMRLLVDAAYQSDSLEQFESTVDSYLGKE